MKRSVLFISLSLLFLVPGCMSTLGRGACSPDFIQDYYKNQGYSQFVEAIKAMAYSLSDQINQKDVKQEDLEHSLNLSTVYIAHILKQYPNYLAEYEKDFSNLSFYEKALFLRGIRSTSMKHDLLNNISDKELERIVNDRNVPMLSSLNHFQVKDGGDIDYLWASFFATGNEAYIRQIIDEILNKDDEMLFWAYNAYQWFYQKKGTTSLLDLLEKKEEFHQAMKMKEEKNKDYPIQVTIIYSALWSLDANARQDPTIWRIIQKIIKNEPSLDYWKKINKIRKNSNNVA